MKHPNEAAEETYARALAELEAEDAANLCRKEREFFDRADRHVRVTIGIGLFFVVVLVAAEALGYA